jgi:hypothetical protein
MFEDDKQFWAEELQWQRHVLGARAERVTRPEGVLTVVCRYEGKTLALCRDCYERLGVASASGVGFDELVPIRGRLGACVACTGGAFASVYTPVVGGALDFGCSSLSSPDAVASSGIVRRDLARRLH